jgi:hypothetical protein
MWAGVLFVLVIAAFFLGGNIYNFLWRKRLNKLMSYLSQHHPNLYAKIKPTRILGFYPDGAFRASMRFVHNHESLDDPGAEELLADYAYWSDPIKAVVFLLVPIFVVAIFATVVTFLYVVFFVIGKQ